MHINGESKQCLLFFFLGWDIRTEGKTMEHVRKRYAKSTVTVQLQTLHYARQGNPFA